MLKLNKLHETYVYPSNDILDREIVVETKQKKKRAGQEH